MSVIQYLPSLHSGVHSAIKIDLFNSIRSRISNNNSHFFKTFINIVCTTSIIHVAEDIFKHFNRTFPAFFPLNYANIILPASLYAFKVFGNKDSTIVKISEAINNHLVHVAIVISIVSQVIFFKVAMVSSIACFSLLTLWFISDHFNFPIIDKVLSVTISVLGLYGFATGTLTDKIIDVAMIIIGLSKTVFSFMSGKAKAKVERQNTLNSLEEVEKIAKGNCVFDQEYTKRAVLPFIETGINDLLGLKSEISTVVNQEQVKFFHEAIDFLVAECTHEDLIPTKDYRIADYYLRYITEELKQLKKDGKAAEHKKLLGNFLINLDNALIQYNDDKEKKFAIFHYVRNQMEGLFENLHFPKLKEKGSFKERIEVSLQLARFELFHRIYEFEQFGDWEKMQQMGFAEQFWEAANHLIGLPHNDASPFESFRASVFYYFVDFYKDFWKRYKFEIMIPTITQQMGAQNFAAEMAAWGFDWIQRSNEPNKEALLKEWEGNGKLGNIDDFDILTKIMLVDMGIMQLAKP